MPNPDDCPYCGAPDGGDCRNPYRCRSADDAHDSSCPGCPDCRGIRNTPEEDAALR